MQVKSANLKTNGVTTLTAMKEEIDMNAARATHKQLHTDRAWQAALSSTKADDVTFIERPCITERLAAPVTALNAGITGAVIVVLVVARWYFFGE